MIVKGLYTDDIRVILDQLINSCNDFQLHQHIWAENLHSFPPRWSPPLYLNPMFREEFLLPEIKALLELARLQNKTASDLLYDEGIPEISNLSDEPLSYFENSFIQNLLRY